MKIQNVKSLPEVLTIEQVHQIIDGCRTQRMAVFFWKQPPPPTGREDECLAGGSQTRLGLRLEEALNLHVGDIDSKRMMVHVHRGKGAKDRYIPLPESMLLLLRAFWKTHQHRKFVFPADGRNHRGESHPKGRSQAKTPMSVTAVQGAIKQITRKIDFGKRISTHTLRHCYATHLLGVRSLQS